MDGNLVRWVGFERTRRGVGGINRHITKVNDHVMVVACIEGDTVGAEKGIRQIPDSTWWRDLTARTVAITSSAFRSLLAL